MSFINQYIAAFFAFIMVSIFYCDSAVADQTKSVFKVCKKSDNLYLSKNCRGNFLKPAELKQLANKNCQEIIQRTKDSFAARDQAGSEGPKGEKGSRGDDGAGLFAKLPSGAVIRGYAGDKINNFEPTAKINYYESFTTFPYKNSEDLKPENIEVIYSAPESLDKHITVPGKLRVYILIQDNAENIKVTPLGKIGFSLKWNVPASGYTEVRAAFAYQSGNSDE